MAEIGVAARSGTTAGGSAGSGARRPDTRRSDPRRPRSPGHDGDTRRGAVVRAARWSATHRWAAVGVWVLFVLLAAGLGGAIGNRQINPVRELAGKSGTAARATDAVSFGDRPTESVLIQPRGSGPADRSALDGVATDLSRRYAALPGVSVVSRPVPSAADGRSLMLPVALDTGDRTGTARSDEAARLLAPMRRVTDEVAAAHPDLRVEQVGETSINTGVQRQISADLHRAELTSVPLTLLILLIAFGALLAAVVPVVLAMTAVAGALGLAAFASLLMPMDPATSSVVLLIGMAVGVDYSLFYVKREREERARGVTGRAGIEIAAATSGRAVVVSGLTVLIAMAGLLVAGNPVFVSMAVGTMLVVAVAMAGSVTVLPALLSLFGERIDRPRVPLVYRWRSAGDGSRIWSRVLRMVLARPALSLTLAGLAMLALATPALGMRLKSMGGADLPRSIPVVRGYDRLNAAFPGQGAAHTIVLTGTGGALLDRDRVTAAVDELTGRARASGEFALPERVRTEFSTDGRVARVNLPIPYDAQDRRAAGSLDLLRDRLLPQTVDRLPGVWAGVTGGTAIARDLTAQLDAHLPYVFGFVLLCTFGLMLLAFRSVVVAGLSIVLNLLSVGAAYGVMVLVFQHTWAEKLLNFRSNGGVIWWMPLFLFVILFGLSMDYHVFVLSRVREGVECGLSTTDAVRDGLVRSAGTVTSAATVMVFVFAIFATLSLPPFKQLGVGLAAAILLDATLVRGVLLPAAMAVLGRFNWYLPTWLRWLPLVASP